MKIYAQYSKCKTLPQGSGDFINEAGLYTAMSQFANVFYSGQMFFPSGPNFGLKEYNGSIASHVPQDCDLYYIRASLPALRAVPKGKPVLWVASPFEPEAYARATIAAFTQSWADRLQAGANFPWFPKEHRKPYPNTVALRQVVGNAFQLRQGAPQTRKIRRQITCLGVETDHPFVIGHLGRIVKSNYPTAFLKLWPEMVKKNPDLRFLVGTTRGTLGKLPNSLERKFPHDQMPYVVSACDVMVVSDHGESWKISGSIKSIEASLCGVPTILGRSPAREELFGKHYPLFVPPIGTGYDDVAELKRVLDLVIDDYEFRMSVGRYVQEVAQKHRVKASSVRFERLFRKLIEEAKQ